MKKAAMQRKNLNTKGKTKLGGSLIKQNGNRAYKFL